MEDLFRIGASYPPRIMTRVAEGLPSDARIVNVQLGWPRSIELLIESDEWEPAPEGARIPDVDVMLETCDPAEAVSR